MDIAEIVEKMIGLSDGNVEDINHFMKVWAYARMIGKKEWVEMRSQYILEAAAVIHDIACPLCREKYGNADGKHQEAESEPLVRAFFAGTDVNAEVIDRIVYLVTHHHSPDAVDGLDYQILIEADYLVNADEMGLSAENIRNFRDCFFRTRTGTDLLNMIYTKAV